MKHPSSFVTLILDVITSKTYETGSRRRRVDCGSRSGRWDWELSCACSLLCLPSGVAHFVEAVLREYSRYHCSRVMDCVTAFVSRLRPPLQRLAGVAGRTRHSRTPNTKPCQSTSSLNGRIPALLLGVAFFSSIGGCHYNICRKCVGVPGTLSFQFAVFRFVQRNIVA